VVLESVGGPPVGFLDVLDGTRGGDIRWSDSPVKIDIGCRESVPVHMASSSDE
jgi:hypothetical protein